ncbi:TetR/AcrR family transcriptional regulator [Skermania sp. ID1734]|uniref:TetR/AcrR family transcriptional regulator n=1 Tax=Skermania sp. ID1734 TaxID=2597516 RepID=UPI00117BDF91|nr:TetR/AcrR family transcriptional regulator [Skermania sp. ID1734]TSD96571.1 TetR/AcrR family transcriptional regulator [Skermania sp. ID1734]
MARQQERARRTRAAIVKSAAAEFAKSGYAAASLARILEGSNATKGAMYFHFDSKEDLARAVMDESIRRYAEFGDRWISRTDLEPLQILHGLVDEMALRFQHDDLTRAQFRLIIEPELQASGVASGSQLWGKSAYQLAMRAQELGHLRAEVQLETFVRTLGALIAGHRYIADLFGDRSQLRPLYNEGFEVLLEASATSEWLERFRREGWPVDASLEDLESE